MFTETPTWCIGSVLLYKTEVVVSKQTKIINGFNIVFHQFFLFNDVSLHSPPTNGGEAVNAQHILYCHLWCSGR